MFNCIIFGLQLTAHSHNVGPRSSVPESIGTAALSRHLSVFFCSSYPLIIFPTLHTLLLRTSLTIPAKL